MMTAAHAEALNDEQLRKTWLKQRFVSYEYQEQLLTLHQQWYGLVQTALMRPEVERDYPEKYKFFREVAFKNLDKVPKPGQVSREFQQAHYATGSFRSIADYQEIMYPSYWEWMTDAEREASQLLWIKMSRMSQNTRYTVDGRWNYEGTDDWILDEEYTGPINWPANWRDQVLGEQAAALADKDATRIKAGTPVREAGTYVALDPRDRRFTVAVGDHLPDLDSSYGITVWQRVAE